MRNSKSGSFSAPGYFLPGLLLLCLIGLPSVNASETLWRVVHSSDFHGELKPCGCSVKGNLGGVLRRASRLTQLRQEGIATVFVSAGDILGQHDEQGSIKARYMLEAHAKLSLDAILPGERDLAYPVTELTAQPLPWVLTNQTGDYPFETFQEKRIGDRRLLIFGLLDPKLTDPKSQNKLINMQQALQTSLKTQHVTEQDLVLVLMHANAEKTQALTQHPLVDVVVRGHLDKPVKETITATDHTTVLAAGHRGHRIGIADFRIDDTTQLIRHRIETLTSSVPDDPAMAHLYTEYDEKVSDWYRNKIAARQRSSDVTSPFATEKVCAHCHIKTAALWQKSQHANALATLTAVGKNNDPECLECHNTGFGKKGGFLAPKVTPELANVQCEACHDAAHKHAAYPLAHKPASLTHPVSQQCTHCHNKEHSPSFDFAHYWQKIIHYKETNLIKHHQTYSPIQGEYTLLNNKQPVIRDGPIVITEYFSFYCSRCYILNKAWKNIASQLNKPVQHQQIPITFGKQQPWAALAYLAATRQGKGDAFKKAIFNALFEQHADINKKETLIAIAETQGIGNSVLNALNKIDTPEDKELARGMMSMGQLDITATPTVIINNNLQVSAKNTADNINLMIANLEEILLDIQCLQHGVCN